MAKGLLSDCSYSRQSVGARGLRPESEDEVALSTTFIDVG